MNPVEFPQQTAVIKTPGFRDLPMFANHEQTVTCWELTPEELAEVQRTGKVWCSLTYTPRSLGYVIPMLLSVEGFFQPGLTVQEAMEQAKFLILVREVPGDLGVFLALSENEASWEGHLIAPVSDCGFDATEARIGKDFLRNRVDDHAYELTQDRAEAWAYLEHLRVQLGETPDIKNRQLRGVRQAPVKFEWVPVEGNALSLDREDLVLSMGPFRTAVGQIGRVAYRTEGQVMKALDVPRYWGNCPAGNRSDLATVDEAREWVTKQTISTLSISPGKLHMG